MGLVPGLLLALGGIALTVWASRIVVGRAVRIVAGRGISPFLVGIILFALGTDLPEIANSVAAAVRGHGDVLLGNSIGSAVAQSTLILAILGVTGRRSAIERRDAVTTGVVTVGGLVVTALLVRDGALGRVDGLMLVGLWAVGSVVVWRVAPPEQLQFEEVSSRTGRDLAVALGGLAVVAVGALAAVEGFVGLAAGIGVSEFIISFFLAAVGTSLPELVVNLTAMRRGESTMALGGILGASMLDASVSIGVGPILAPVAVTASAGMTSALLAAAALAAVAAVLAWRRQHDWRSAVLFLVLYGAFFPLLLG